MTREILMMAPLPAAQMAVLEEKFTLHRLWQAQDPEALLNVVKENVHGIVSFSGRAAVSARLVRALPNLEIIANDGMGTDHIDLKAARERDVVVTNTPDLLTDDTADLGMGLVLAVLRRMVEADIYTRTGQWSRRGHMPPGRALKGRTMGIVGLGRIGTAVAQRAVAFGIRVVWHGPRQKPKAPWPHYADLANMAEAADILMLACPYGPDTHHLVDARILKALGKKGVLVNIARGKVVDESALVDALEGGVIAGAGLDVFENEPDVPSALCRLDNVVLQPHQAGSTAEGLAATAQMTVDNLVGWFEKGEALTPV